MGEGPLGCDRRPAEVAVGGAELKEPATIVALDGDGVWVETQRRGVCNACTASKGCGQGLMNRLLPGRAHYVRALRAPGLCRELAVGDRVEITIQQNLLLASSALVYLLPLLLLLGGSLVGDRWWPGDPGAILGGVIGLGLGFATVRLHAYRQRNNVQLQPRVHWPAESDSPSIGPAADQVLSVNDLSRVKT